MFFGVSRYVSSIERFRDQTAEAGSEGVARFLDLALLLSEGKEDIGAAREKARRRADRPLEEIETRVQVARQIGEESYAEQHWVMELLQAAAVGRSGLLQRSMLSEMLAMAAEQADRLDRARLAYADAAEGLLILNGFFQPDVDRILAVEVALWSGWDDIKGRTEPALEMFDPATEDPAADLVDLIAWNTDEGGGQGLLAQIDATLRLAFRLEHLVNQGHALDPLAERIASGCTFKAAGDAFLRARYLVTLGDALAEAGQWEAAVPCLRDARAVSLEGIHPLGVHSLVQEAYCHLMAGDLGTCRAALEAVDVGALKQLAELVITVAAELARYHAVDQLCRHREGAAPSPDTRARIADLMRRVAAIVSMRGEEDRTRYLRNLFFSVLARDVESMLAAAS